MQLSILVTALLAARGLALAIPAPSEESRDTLARSAEPNDAAKAPPAAAPKAAAAAAPQGDENAAKGANTNAPGFSADWTLPGNWGDPLGGLLGGL